MLRFILIVAGLLTAAWLCWAQGDVTQKASARPRPQDVFHQSLEELVSYTPDPCDPPNAGESDGRTSAAEDRLFDAASDIVVDALNVKTAAAGAPKDRATTALKRLEDESARINTAWPKDNQFHFEVLDVNPILVVKMGVRSHETFFVFGIEAIPGKAHGTWSMVGEDETLDRDKVPRSFVGLYALHRRPSGNARFLATFGLVGCAGSYDIAYDAREWDPNAFAGLTHIIKQTGAGGLDDVREFPRIGSLKTEGPLLTIPYCWFSPIDTWDNPSLCAVDSYDLSGDDVKFISRAYNRPDLLPVAKAIEYAEQHDFGALGGYCVSTQLAESLIRDLPPSVFAGSAIHVTPTGTGKERVELGDGPTYRFDVEKRNGRWLVAAFASK